MLSIRDILIAFENPKARAKLIEELRTGGPDQVRNWDIVRRMFGGLSPSSADEVHPSLSEMALQLFDAGGAAIRKTLVAAQVPLAATALRGAQQAPFHELFEVEGHEIDLSWTDDEMLVGQVMVSEGESAFDGGACVLYGAEAPRQVAIESFGEFELSAVSPGSYELAIEIPDRLLLVPDLEFRLP